MTEDVHRLLAHVSSDCMVDRRVSEGGVVEVAGTSGAAESDEAAVTVGLAGAAGLGGAAEMEALEGLDKASGFPCPFTTVLSFSEYRSHFGGSW